MKSNLTPEVESVGKMHFEGNIIPHRWYQTLTYTTPGGQVRPHLEAILILSDLVYWYRPAEVRDENTGKLLGYRKKFREDLLQRSYQTLADQFGLSKRQVQRAISFLKEEGLIDVEFRTIATKTGMVLSNVTYIRLIPERLLEVTFSFLDTPISKFGDTLPPNLETPVSEIGETYTETSAETSSEISLSASREREPAALPPEVVAWYTSQGLEKHLSREPDLLLAAYRSCLEDRDQENFPGVQRRVMAVLHRRFEVPPEPSAEGTSVDPIPSAVPVIFTIPSVDEL